MSMFEEEETFGYFNYQKISSGFCHLQPLSCRFAIQTDRLKFASQQTLTAKNGKCVIAETSTLTADFSRVKVTAASAPKSLSLKCALPDPQYSLFGSALADSKLQNCSITVGAQKLSEQLSWKAAICGNLKSGKNQYQYLLRILSAYGGLRLGISSLHDGTSKKHHVSNAVVEIKPDQKHSFYLRRENGQSDFYAANYVFRHSATFAMMLEGRLVGERPLLLEGTFEKVLPSRKLKLRVNSQHDVTFLVQSPLQWSSDSTFSFGLQVADVLNTRKISYGFRIDVNS